MLQRCKEAVKAGNLEEISDIRVRPAVLYHGVSGMLGAWAVRRDEIQPQLGAASKV